MVMFAAHTFNSLLKTGVQNGCLSCPLSEQIETAHWRSKVASSEKVAMFNKTTSAAVLCTPVSLLPMRLCPEGAPSDGTQDLPFNERHVLVVGLKTSGWHREPPTQPTGAYRR